MDSIALVLILIGVILLIAEIFLPSFGISGILGVISILFGVIFTAETFMGGLLLFIIILVVTIIIMALLFKFVVSKKSPLILKDINKTMNNEEDMTIFIGKEGKAITPLRPSGSVLIEGLRLDVLTQGDFIDKEEEVVVQSVHGKKIFVIRK